MILIPDEYAKPVPEHVTERIRNTFNLVILVLLQWNSGAFTASKILRIFFKNLPQPIKTIKYVDNE